MKKYDNLDEIIDGYEITDFSKLKGRDYYSIKITDMENTNFGFLKSERFWQLFLVGLAVGLNFPFPGNAWVQGLSAMISVWFGGSVAVRTFDRQSDKALEGSKIEAGQSTEKSKIL